MEKKPDNILLIVIVVAVALCLCCAVGACVAAGVGVFVIRADEGVPAIEPYEPLPAIETEEPLATEEPFDPTLPQGGLGNNELRKRVWDFVTSLAEKDADCKSPLPAATIIIVSKEADADGTWEEAWTLFCENGPTPVYRIIFTPNSNGTINFSPGLISK